MIRRTLKWVTLPALVILVGFLVYLYFRPIPKTTPVSQIISVPKVQKVNLPWPATGQAAIGASGYGVLEKNNTDTPAPIASIAKVITSLAVLKQKPITPGTQGVTITLGPADVSLFNSYYSNDGSVAKVAVGEQLTEFQALQAMLIPSANNIADSVAIWAFGSLDAYTTYANQMVRSMGLTHTKVGDASGFSDTTTSTADDLVKLGIVAVNNSSIAQIVSQPSVDIPINGVTMNVNFLLGQDGINGIKTGNTDKAGGCYLFAADRIVQGQKIKLVGAILAQPSLADSLRLAPPLIRASDSGFISLTPVHKNQELGYYQSRWGTKSQFNSAKDLSMLAWQGQQLDVSVRPADLSAPANSGSNVGVVTVKSGQLSISSPLVLNQNLAAPTWHWKIFKK